LQRSLSQFFLAITLVAGAASAQNLAPNQTQGFGDGKLLTLSYTQNFDCIDQPKDDLNYNGIPAAADPGEMQTPICVVGINTSINPPGQVGNPLSTTEPLYVLIPLFSLNNDQNVNDAISCNNVVQGTTCGTALGQTLIQLFGAIPEAFKTTPLVFTQCPDPGTAPGTCTMHASRLDLGPVLAALGYIPPPMANVFLPTPNHSHLLLGQDINLKPIWWQVVPVLVTNPSVWPTEDGSSGITTIKALDAALSAGDAVATASNFFLFFGSSVEHGQMAMSH